MELEIIKNEVRPIVKQASAITIKTAEDMEGAVELLSNVNRQLDMVKDEELKVTKPLKEALKAETDRWKPMKDAMKIAVDTLRLKIGTYQTEADRATKLAEAKLAARVDKGTLKMSTAVRKLGELDKPEEKVATMAGSVSFRTLQTLKITKEADIPREYLVVDEKRLLDALKAGVVVPGAEIEEIKSVVNKR